MKDLIIIKLNDLEISFNLARRVGSEYKIEYLVKMIEVKRSSEIDKKSLEESIIKKLNNEDAKYLILKEFSTFKAVFWFDYRKWLKDSASNITPVKDFAGFRKVFKFSKPIPKVISYDFIQVGFSAFIVDKFQKFIKLNRKEKSWFSGMLSDENERKMMNKFDYFFNFSYDYQTNSITATVNPIYIGILLVAANQIQKTKKFTNFFESVKSNFKDRR